MPKLLIQNKKKTWYIMPLPLPPLNTIREYLTQIILRLTTTSILFVMIENEKQGHPRNPLYLPNKKTESEDNLHILEKRK